MTKEQLKLFEDKVQEAMDLNRDQVLTSVHMAILENMKESDKRNNFITEVMIRAKQIHKEKGFLKYF